MAGSGGRDAEGGTRRAGRGGPPGARSAQPRGRNASRSVIRPAPPRGRPVPPPPANSEPSPPRLAEPPSAGAARPIRGDVAHTAHDSFASCAAIGWPAPPAGVPWRGGEIGGRTKEQPETALALIGGSSRRRHARGGAIEMSVRHLLPPPANRPRWSQGGDLHRGAGTCICMRSGAGRRAVLAAAAGATRRKCPAVVYGGPRPSGSPGPSAPPR